MKYFFPLAGFQLGTFNDEVEKNKKIYREGRKKITRKSTRKGGKNVPEISPSSRFWSGVRILDMSIYREFICSVE
jgi:hypothetical protein